MRRILVPEKLCRRLFHFFPKVIDQNVVFILIIPIVSHTGNTGFIGDICDGNFLVRFYLHKPDQSFVNTIYRQSVGTVFSCHVTISSLLSHLPPVVLTGFFCVIIIILRMLHL